MNEPIQNIIRKTDHIGVKHNTPSNENSEESTVEGMIWALKIMLNAYEPDTVKRAAKRKINETSNNSH